MRLIWMILFVVLVFCQLLAFLTGWIPKRWVAPVEAASVAGLTDVARQTRDAWNEFIFPDIEVARSAPNQIGGAVLEREQLLLQLRDVEEALSALYGEIRIVEELDAWIAASSGKLQQPGDPRDLINYMDGLLGWLKPFLLFDDSIVMERSFLVPDTRSVFPSLCFELRGSPPELGSRLLAYEEHHCDWHLNELDLNRTEDGSGWWLRGSYAYGGEGL